MEDNYYLQKFLLYIKRVKGYSELTVKAYRRDISSLLAFLKGENISLYSLELKDISLFLTSLYNSNLSKRSVRRMLSSYRQFYNYLIRYHDFSFNPFLLVFSPKTEEKIPDFLSFDDMCRFLDANNKREDYLKDRDQAILELTFASGLRASEIISLKVDDISFQERMLNIIGKGNKQRRVPFSVTARDSIVKYLQSLRPVLLKEGVKDNGYVFLNSKGRKLTERGLEYIVDKASFKSGFNLHIHPHMLRHSFATTMINNGVDIKVIQKLLGHESIKTTSIYTHVSYDELRRTYDEYFKEFEIKEKKSMCKGIIFDFNGTMFFDDEMQELSWYIFAKEEFKRDITEDEFLSHIHGFSNKNIMEYLAGREYSKEEILALATKKEKIYQRLCEEKPGYLKLVDGLEDFLYRLKENNIVISICTSSMKPNVDWYFEKFDLYRFFKYEECIYDDGNLKRGKPDPEIFLKAISHTGLKPKEVIVFEDSYSGILSAKNAGVEKIVKVGKKDVNLPVTLQIDDYLSIEDKISFLIHLS